MRELSQNIRNPMSTVIESPQEEVTAEGLLFRDLPLSEEVQLAVQMAGYLTPTPIQAEILPHILDGKDVLAQSQTGTGKTAAFALPILSKLDLSIRDPQVLVLAPTRELATQVAKSFETYGACMPKLSVAAIYGGADYEPQLRLLKRGAHIVVGTPGRVLDHIRRGTLKLEGIRCLVLDEADEMLNMGFIEDVEFVLNATPAEKQIALFSATLPGPIRKIADQHLKDPESITIKRKTLTADNIQQRCVFVDEREKLELLSRLIELEETDGVIVFTKTKDSTLYVAEHLVGLGLKAAALNGDLPQARRQRTVDQLKSGQLDIIVATDVAARGLDVQRISHVFNFDLPHDGESYVHRIGRTGRAGRAGVAVIFLTHRQRGKLRLIEKVTKKMIEVIEPPTAAEIANARISRFKTQITKTLGSDELGLFEKVISDYVKESGQPVEKVAAALAHLAQGGRSLLVKDMPRKQRDLGGRGRDDFGSRGDFGARGNRSLGDRSRGRDRDERDGAGEKGRPRRAVGPPEAGMQRYWIGVGHSDGVRPNNIVGAIANEAGISSRDMGPINIRDEFSTIDLPAGLTNDVLSTLEKTWVSGKQLRIRVYSDRSAPRSKSYAPASSTGKASVSDSYNPGGKAAKSDRKPKRERSGEGKSFKAIYAGEKPAFKKFKKKVGKAGKPVGKKKSSK